MTAYLIPLICVLACPLLIGGFMWFVGRGTEAQQLEREIQKLERRQLQAQKRALQARLQERPEASNPDPISEPGVEQVKT